MPPKGHRGTQAHREGMFSTKSTTLTTGKGQKKRTLDQLLDPYCPLCIHPMCGEIMDCGVGGHPICLKCFSSLKEKRCPMCKVDYAEKQSAIRNRTLERILLDIGAVKCGYEGCDKKIDMSEMAAHMKTCEHGVSECNLGCKEMVRNTDQVQHKHMVCPMKDVGCQSCKKHMKRQDVAKHIMEVRSILFIPHIRVTEKKD